jgi:hypothetical protein
LYWEVIIDNNLNVGVHYPLEVGIEPCVLIYLPQVHGAILSLIEKVDVVELGVDGEEKEACEGVEDDHEACVAFHLSVLYNLLSFLRHFNWSSKLIDI